MAVFKRVWKTEKGKEKSAYCVDFYDLQGRKRRRTFPSLRSATKAEAAIKTDLLRGEFRFAKLEKVLFDNFAKEYVDQAKLDGKVSKNYENSKKNLMGFFAGMYLSEISVEDVEDFKKKRLADGMKPSSINRELAALSGLFRLARKRKIFRGENPVHDVEKFREQRGEIKTLTPEECRRLATAIEDRFKPVLVLALDTA